MSAVVLSEVTKQFGENTVVSRISLEVKEHEFMSLLGPSGCGKTTLLRMIAGLEEPTDGKISIGGRQLFDRSNALNVPPEKRELGMVFQSYAIWPHLSVLENVTFPLRCRRVPKGEREEKALAALASVRLDGLECRRPHQLSGGQQQRVALARALVYQPKVLLLDEPLSNLDANLRDEMCEEFTSLRNRNPVTMIYVTHDQSEAFRLSDRIALLDHGRLVQLGTTQELRTNPADEFVRKFLRLPSSQGNNP